MRLTDAQSSATDMNRCKNRCSDVAFGIRRMVRGLVYIMGESSVVVNAVINMVLYTLQHWDKRG